MFKKIMIAWAVILGFVAVALMPGGHTGPVQNDHSSGMIFLLMIFVSYFAPALIAKLRRHYNTTAIFVLNLFLGWTFIGWVIALVWAFTNNREVVA